MFSPLGNSTGRKNIFVGNGFDPRRKHNGFDEAKRIYYSFVLGDLAQAGRGGPRGPRMLILCVRVNWHISEL